MTTPTFTTPPPAPNRQQDQTTFRINADNSWAWLGSNFFPELTTSITWMESQVSTIVGVGSGFVGDWSQQTGAASVPYSVSHNGSIWVLTQNIVDVAANEPGVAAVWISTTNGNIAVDENGVISFSNYVKFTSATGTGSATERWIGSDGANNTYYNVPSTKKHLFGVSNVNVLSLENSKYRHSSTLGVSLDYVIDGANYSCQAVNAGMSWSLRDVIGQQALSVNLGSLHTTLGGSTTIKPLNGDFSLLNLNRNLDVNQVGAAGTKISFQAKSGAADRTGASITGVLGSDGLAGSINLNTANASGVEISGFNIDSNQNVLIPNGDLTLGFDGTSSSLYFESTNNYIQRNSATGDMEIATAPGSEINLLGNVNIGTDANGITIRNNGTFSTLPVQSGSIYANASSGLAVHGDGSITDFVILNSAGGGCVQVPSGTTNLVMPSGSLGIGTSATSNKLTWSGGSYSQLSVSEGALYGDSGGGAVIHGRGSSYDVTILNNTGQSVARVPTSTSNMQFDGNVAIGTPPTSSRIALDGAASIITLLSNQPTTSGIQHFIFSNPNGTVGSVTTSGTTTSYNVTSDNTLKDFCTDQEAAEFSGFSSYRELVDSNWDKLVGSKKFFHWKNNPELLVNGFAAFECIDSGLDIGTERKGPRKKEDGTFYEVGEVYKTDVIPEITETKVLERQKTEAKEIEVERIKIINGNPVLCLEKETQNMPVFQDLPVFNEAGEPVMTTIIVGKSKSEQILDEEGNPVFTPQITGTDEEGNPIISNIPVMSKPIDITEEVQLTHKVPVMEEYEEVVVIQERSVVEHRVEPAGVDQAKAVPYLIDKIVTLEARIRELEEQSV